MLSGRAAGSETTRRLTHRMHAPRSLLVPTVTGERQGVDATRHTQRGDSDICPCPTKHAAEGPMLIILAYPVLLAKKGPRRYESGPSPHPRHHYSVAVSTSTMLCCNKQCARARLRSSYTSGRGKKSQATPHDSQYLAVKLRRCGIPQEGGLGSHIEQR
ncbi:hypothetical protein TRVL_10271 [Trypanosoma vivax]|nr:hypothetical protein TRVL_10271 [Trypanosoma vivax]